MKIDDIRKHMLLDNRLHIRDLIHLFGLSIILLIWFLFIGVIHPVNMILLIFAWEIIVNIKYPVEHFPRYYLVNIIGILIFLSMIIFRQMDNIWFQWQWLLTFQGMVFVLVTPIFGYGIRRILTNRKQNIYLLHILMPGFIMLITKIIQNPVHGPALVMSALMVILWQIYGSVGITARNFLKFYLANVIGLVLFVIVFSDEQFFIMSLPNWIEENSWLLDYVLGLPLFGLIIGFFREGYKTMASDDSQKVGNNEKKCSSG